MQFSTSTIERTTTAVKTTEDTIKRLINDAIATKEAIVKDSTLIKKLANAATIIATCLNTGKKLLIAGNGGSASDAQHFTAEIIGRFEKERRAFPAITLSTDNSVASALANDYSYEEALARQIEGLGNPQDVFIGISTSGNSQNIIHAFQQAKKSKLSTIGLLGKGGGKAKNLPDLSIIVPTTNTKYTAEYTARTQEAHIMMIHIICSEVEKLLCKISSKS